MIEQFEGFVDQIDGDVAYVTLTNEHGDRLFGQYSAARLAEKGIRERRRFTCITVERNGAVRVDMEPIPDREPSAEEEKAIDDAIEQLLGTNEFTNESSRTA